MEAFNLVAGAVLLFAESIAVKGVEGAGKARISYIILSILSIVLAALQVGDDVDKWRVVPLCE